MDSCLQSPKIRHALIVTGDFVQTGGMDVGNYMLAEDLARHGTEVHLVAFRVAEPLRSLPNVVWHRVPKPLRSYTLALPLLDHYGRRVARRVAGRGGRIIVNGGCCWWGDVNWVHYVHAAHQPIVRTSLLRRWASRYNHARWLHEERRALRDARLVVTNSERTRRDVIERVGVAPEQTRTIYYGIDGEKFCPADHAEQQTLRARLGWAANRPVALFIGNLGDRRKGFDVLFEAWRQRCQDTRWDADLLVVGAGAEMTVWQQRTEAEGLSQRLRFLGFRRDVHDLLRAADLLVAPTRYEAYGLGVHEALCCGLPAIVSADAGIAERYPAKLRRLLLSSTDDVAALVDRLQDWRDQAEEYRAVLQTFSSELRAWSWADMARQFGEALRETRA